MSDLVSVWDGAYASALAISTNAGPRFSCEGLRISEVESSAAPSTSCRISSRASWMCTLPTWPTGLFTSIRGLIELTKSPIHESPYRVGVFDTWGISERCTSVGPALDLDRSISQSRHGLSHEYWERSTRMPTTSELRTRDWAACLHAYSPHTLGISVSCSLGWAACILPALATPTTVLGLTSLLSLARGAPRGCPTCSSYSPSHSFDRPRCCQRGCGRRACCHSSD